MADNSPLKQNKTRLFYQTGAVGLQSSVPHPNTRLTLLKRCDLVPKIIDHISLQFFNKL